LKSNYSKTERRGLLFLFLPFGVGAMATATRFPEIRDNLHLNNGTFGTILSLGSIGSLIGFLTVGQAVHKYGVKPLIWVGSTGCFGLTALVPHLHSGWQFLLVTIGLGFSMTTFHISDNAQAIHRQEEIGEVILPRLHGMWSLGALITSLLAIAVTPFLTLAWHVDSIMLLMWLATCYGIKKTGPYFISKDEATDASESYSIKSMILGLKTFWIISCAQILALQIEFSINDWSAIYTKDTVKMSAAVSVVSYAVFISAMILLRFNVHKLLEKYSERTLMRVVPRTGGIGFVIFLLAGSAVSSSHRIPGFLLSLIAFAFAGAGSSFMAPTFFGIAFRTSKLPSSVVVAQIGLINVVVTFIAKVIISWVAQATSVTMALMIPGAMLVSASLFAYLGNEKQAK
jgi:MFS family permease